LGTREYPYSSIERVIEEINANLERFNKISITVFIQSNLTLIKELMIPDVDITLKRDPLAKTPTAISFH